MNNQAIGAVTATIGGLGWCVHGHAVRTARRRCGITVGAAALAAAVSWGAAMISTILRATVGATMPIRESGVRAWCMADDFTARDPDVDGVG
jgi:hypothetical protein